MADLNGDSPDAGGDSTEQREIYQTPSKRSLPISRPTEGRSLSMASVV